MLHLQQSTLLCQEQLGSVTPYSILYFHRGQLKHETYIYICNSNPFLPEAVGILLVVAPLFLGAVEDILHSYKSSLPCQQQQQYNFSEQLGKREVQTLFKTAGDKDNTVFF